MQDLSKAGSRQHKQQHGTKEERTFAFLSGLQILAAKLWQHEHAVRASDLVSMLTEAHLRDALLSQATCQMSAAPTR